ncbi:protein of unknown function [Xenorhabdus bovienii]|uniref:Uncharacterized protein n=1 Tax=Xenorhabdus bovienii TaxID=40576 RepID=A0A0B6XE62_XENBV|nr:protein of unknown function [Xenorhabdus bovienii]
MEAEFLLTLKAVRTAFIVPVVPLVVPIKAGKEAASIGVFTGKSICLFTGTILQNS